MNLTLKILKKVAKGGLFVTLSYLSIIGIYNHSDVIANWYFSGNALWFFPILIKTIGIIWCLAFLRLGFDWVVFNMNPFKIEKDENE